MDDLEGPNPSEKHSIIVWCSESRGWALRCRWDFDEVPQHIMALRYRIGLVSDTARMAWLVYC
jgi:hypothetical protein